jgi:phosphopantothenate-cysteine ligase
LRIIQLETDPNLLLSKAREALQKYGHEIVIGNVLNTRKNQVVFVSSDSEVIVKKDDEHDIEEKIVQKLVELHTLYTEAHGQHT